jgi:ATP-dependent Clp protease ATP-binding subunit ClpC
MDDEAHFTFRGEPKPTVVPDAPPVTIGAGKSDETGEVESA